jgi:ribonuclease Y
MSFFRSFAQVLKTKDGDSQRGPKGKKPTGYLKHKPKQKQPQQQGQSGKNTQSAPAQQPVVQAPVATGPSQEELDKIQKEAEEKLRQAENRAREVLVQAKSEALKLREQAEREARESQDTLAKQQEALDRQLQSLNARLDQVDRREQQLDSRFEVLEKQKQDLEKRREELIKELERAAHLSREQAKQELLERLEREVDQQAALMIQQKIAAAEEEVDNKAKELLVDAMKHGATDYVVEYTVSSVPLGSADMKGRIIGKDGRNIRAFERATGVDIELDEGDEVRITSFDPVRREVARQTLEKLMKDGRIQPSRIEELVERTRQDLDKAIFEAGKQLAHRFNVYDLPREVIQAMGRFKYRFSYGQNMIHHMIEVTQIGKKLSQELELDTRTVVLGCLLHDIGKVLEGEGSHVQLGVQFLKRHRIPQEVIDCVAQHHEDEPFTSAESVVVHIADAVSGARPGARSENREEYIQRLSEMEEIAQAHPEVSKAFAIQAGRELRVLLNPDKSTDRDLQVVAQKVAQQIQEEMQYPGTVTVNVIRELRAVAKAE